MHRGKTSKISSQINIAQSQDTKVLLNGSKLQRGKDSKGQKKNNNNNTKKSKQNTKTEEKQALLHRFYWESFNMAEFIGKFI